MNIHQSFLANIRATIAELGTDGILPADLDTSKISAEPPREAGHGDISTNAAMVLAKAAKMQPRDIAEHLAARLGALDTVTEVKVAGPGFINLTLAAHKWRGVLADILNTGTAYGDSDFGGGAKVNVEYVSANPTGPLHVAHARGAVIGDALAKLMAKAGFDVTTEYYINDAGAQVEALARSAHLRYREALGEDIGEIPEGLYPGDYMIPVGVALAAEHGDAFKEADEASWLTLFRDFAIDRMMDTVKADLSALGIEQDVFTSERDLVDAGAVEDMFSSLDQKGLIYTGVLEPPKGKKLEDWEPRPQTLFKASEFGDDVDRPLKKSDGSWTYFANDIANHYDKFKRGFPIMVDIFGADHGGYVKRMKAAVTAMSGGAADLDVKLCQMVHLKKDGKPMRMSKRAGNFVTLRDLIDEAGRDVVRFIMLTRKQDSQMEFDLDKVLEQTRDNPVFYVQYAHARCRSVLRNAAELFDDDELTLAALAGADMTSLDDPAEMELIKQMAGWPRLIDSAAEAREPHRVAYYLHDLAECFHGLWNKGKDDARLRFIHEDDKVRTLARLALVQSVATVISSGLKVFGVTPVEELR